MPPVIHRHIYLMPLDRDIDSPPLSGYLRAIPWSQGIDSRDFMGLIRVRPSGKIAATVVQTRPGQFATMPVAAL